MYLYPDVCVFHPDADFDQFFDLSKVAMKNIQFCNTKLDSKLNHEESLAMTMVVLLTVQGHSLA